jgi:hypothetical protein
VREVWKGCDMTVVAVYSQVSGRKVREGGNLKGNKIPAPFVQDNTINTNTMQNLPNNRQAFFQ